MGLDSVELVLAVEREFGIRVPDADAASVITVQDLADLVTRLRGRAANAVCPTAAAFYALRRAWVSAGIAERGEIRPDARAARLVGVMHRREAWRAASIAGVQLPALWTPSLIRFFAVGVGMLGTAVVVGIALMARVPTFLFWSIVPVGLAIGIHGAFQLAIPPGVSTVGGLVHASLPGPARPFDREAAVLIRVRELTAEQIGLPLEKVQPGSRFVQDLGLS